MTSSQEAHLTRIKQSFDEAVDKKYRKGQEEHGGDLHHQNASALLDMAINEAIDQVTYLLTLKEVLEG